MDYWYGVNPNCGRCGHLNGQGFCNMTACLYPVIREDSTFVVNPVTNYDRLVSMTPEELAEFLSKNRGSCRALTTESYVCDFYTDDLNTDCKACWLDWLKQGVKA